MFYGQAAAGGSLFFMLSGRVQHGHLLGVKPSLLCWSLWARSATKQRYTRTCAWRAACCIWCALKQFIGAISIGGSRSSAPCVFRGQQRDLRDTARFVNPLMNYSPRRFHVPLRRDSMCHSSDDSVCQSSRKPADYPQTPGRTYWGFADDRPLGVAEVNACLGCAETRVALNHLLFW